MTFVSVVLPVYNESEEIAESLRHVSSYLASEFPDHEIIAVDDGSTDGSADVLERLTASIPHLKVVRYTPNEGKGMAVRRGAEAASGEWLAVVDSDLELPIEMLHEFFEVQRKTHSHVVVGSKYHPDSVVRYPKVRRRLSRGYGFGIRWLFALPVSDTQVGFKLFDRRSVAAVAPCLVVNRFAFDVELLVLLRDLGVKFGEAPVTLTFSKVGLGRMKLRTILNMAAETIGIFLRLYVTGYYARAVSRPAAGVPLSPPVPPSVDA